MCQHCAKLLPTPSTQVALLNHPHKAQRKAGFVALSVWLESNPSGTVLLAEAVPHCILIAYTLSSQCQVPSRRVLTWF